MRLLLEHVQEMGLGKVWDQRDNGIALGNRKVLSGQPECVSVFKSECELEDLYNFNIWLS